MSPWREDSQLADMSQKTSIPVRKRESRERKLSINVIVHIREMYLFWNMYKSYLYTQNLTIAQKYYLDVNKLYFIIHMVYLSWLVPNLTTSVTHKIELHAQSILYARLSSVRAITTNFWNQFIIKIHK